MRRRRRGRGARRVRGASPARRQDNGGERHHHSRARQPGLPRRHTASTNESEDLPSNPVHGYPPDACTASGDTLPCLCRHRGRTIPGWHGAGRIGGPHRSETPAASMLETTRARVHEEPGVISPSSKRTRRWVSPRYGEETRPRSRPQSRARHLPASPASKAPARRRRAQPEARAPQHARASP